MMNIYKTEKGYRLYAKGAPERIGEFFSQYQVEGGSFDDFNSHKEELSKQQEVYAED